LFGVEATEPTPGDLDGLLAGPGQVVRMGGTARVSVVVDRPWRANRLVAEFAARGLPSTVVPTIEDNLGVRTAYSVALAPLAAGWLRGAVKLPPPRFGLDGGKLRLWVIAAGHRDQAGFLLPMASHDEAAWIPIGSALAAAGLPAVLLGPRSGGPAYRIVGRRRIARLAEIIGLRPAEAPLDDWP
jgi:hypothetical protein